MIGLPAIGALAAALSSPDALHGRSPSFACTQARTGIERAVCADPAAAAADRRMALAYRSALKSLSREGRRSLLDNQRAFLARAAAECRPGGIGLLGAGVTLGSCVANLYGSRADALGGAVMVAGGRTFVTLTTERSRPTRPSIDGNLPPQFSESRSLVQIDAPRTAGERRWNRTIRAWLLEGVALASPGPLRFDQVDDPGVVDVEITIVSASPDVISASLGTSYYGGGPHGSYHGRAMLWSLRLGRALTGRDIFAEPSDPRLRQLVASRYDVGGGPGHEGCEAPKVAGRVPTVDRSGVTFTYEPYELGGYPCGGESRVPWTTLAPFLRRPLPFDPDALSRLGRAVAR